MSFYLAKTLQALGIAYVGYALLIGLTEENSMAKELRQLVVGVVVFYLGRYLEGRAAA